MLKKTLPIATAAVLVLVTGCVDHDYDLSKDIDMVVAIGGDATLPGSSTENYTLAQLLNLDANSAIKAVSAGEYGLAEGDYILTQNADPSNYSVEVDRVDIRDLHGSDYSTVLDPFVHTSAQAFVTSHVTNAVNTINISDDDVDTAIKSLSDAYTDIPMQFIVSYNSTDYNGYARIDQGFLVEFDPAWDITITDPATAAFTTRVNNHTLRFTRDVTFSPANPLKVNVNLTHINLRDLPAGQGLYQIGHFRLNNEIISNGDISLATSDMAVGSTAHLTLLTSSHIMAAEITKATGVVDPKITIDNTRFNINDVPDALTAEDNSLNLSDPQLYLDITNQSPVRLKLNAQLKSYNKRGQIATIGVGAQWGTNEIYIEPSGITRLCLSRTGNSAQSGTVNIAVPNLSTLVAQVPTRIEIVDIRANATADEVTLDLGRTYNVSTSYDIVVPLAFDTNNRLHYTTTEKDWDADLNKYNFSTAVAHVDVISTIPFDMVPTVTAIDRNGNDMPNVTATIEGTVTAGALNKASNSTLIITLTSTGANLDGLDGVRLDFMATTPASVSGINLNKSQALRFENITIGIRGGITVDLN